MPELPDVTVYVEALATRIVGRNLGRTEVYGPSVLRSVTPALREFEGLLCVGVRRIGKRIAIEFDGELFLAIHLMISGRLLWREGALPGRRPGGRTTMAILRFDSGNLLLTEAATKKRASLTAVAGTEALKALDAGGIEPLNCTSVEFADALRSENRTLKRAMTNPHKLSGIGNSYSDEILHAAHLSPLKLTQSLTDEEMAALFAATRQVLSDWTTRLRQRLGDKFPGPGQVTAFQPEFAVHGKFGEPCPDCGKPVQRIRYAENETNYCAQCQNEGRVLADRALSRLLKDDWPRNIDEWE
jgi:formamidopyrimidine-DNA glycosylase